MLKQFTIFGWDQVMTMAVVGVFFYILVQNSSIASGDMNTVMQTATHTINNFLTNAGA